MPLPTEHIRKGLDALTYGWELTTEVMGIAELLVNTILERRPGCRRWH